MGCLLHPAFGPILLHTSRVLVVSQCLHGLTADADTTMVCSDCHLQVVFTHLTSDITLGFNRDIKDTVTGLAPEYLHQQDVAKGLVFSYFPTDLQ